VNEFSQLLEAVEDLNRTINVQQLRIEILREQVAKLTEQLYGHAEQPPAEEEAA
jgi:uncharacterized coiled-coil protein SlyX